MTDTVLRTARPTPIPALLNPANLVGNLWSHRDLIKQFTARLFHARYRGTQLGLLWAVILPLMLLGVYTFVFNYIFKSRWAATGEESVVEFAIILLCGMTVFAVFSEATLRAGALVVENPNFVKRVVFPLEILPVASLASSLAYAGIGLALVLVGTAIFGPGVKWTIVLFPLILLPLVLLTLGVSWLLASLGVFLRDISNIVGILVGQILFFVTPVLYDISRLDNLPTAIKRIAYLNPLAPIVDGARKVLIFGQQPDWMALGIVTVVGMLAMQLGYAFFMKSKRGFADVL